MWYIHTVDYYSAIKNEILTICNNIMLSELSQAEKYCTISLISAYKKSKKKQKQTQIQRIDSCQRGGGSGKKCKGKIEAQISK